MSATSLQVVAAVAIFLSGAFSAAQAAEAKPPNALANPSKPQEGRNPPTRRPQAQMVQPCLEATNPNVACTDKLKAKDKPDANAAVPTGNVPRR
jgi:hypothetical protein